MAGKPKRTDIRIFRSNKEADEADRAYYASLTPNERIAIQQEMINRAYGEAASRFERVCHVIKREKDSAASQVTSSQS